MVKHVNKMQKLSVPSTSVTNPGEPAPTSASNSPRCSDSESSGDNDNSDQDESEEEEQERKFSPAGTVGAPTVAQARQNSIYSLPT